MKLKLLLIITLTGSAFSLNACPRKNSTTLSHQYETGALQWQVVRKEVDPNTLIHAAILENAPEVILFLISHGVNIDYPNENGMTPLTIAILNRSTDAVEILLKHGANVNPNIKWNGLTLLEIAFHMKDWKSAAALTRHGTNVNGCMEHLQLLTYALVYGSSNPELFTIAKELITHGTTITPEDIYNAIRNALNQFDISVLELMIQMGVDFNVEDLITGYSLPIIQAVNLWSPTNPGQNPDVIKLLIKAGADINKVSANNSALLNAIRSGRLDKVKFVVELGADVNKKAVYQNKIVLPLTLALNLSRPEIVQYLLQHGARS